MDASADAFAIAIFGMQYVQPHIGICGQIQF